MQLDPPLLTIAIPTYNRSRFLAVLLSSLREQLGRHSQIELIISDNASSDETSSLVSNFLSHAPQGVNIRYIRNERNIGPDANFLQCFQEARGKYVWLLGDDDIIVPSGLDKLIPLLEAKDYALIYLNPYPFRDDSLPGRERDRFGRFAQRIPNGPPFIRIVGPMITFISSQIVNKKRFDRLDAPKLANLIDTCLIQLGWSLPLLASGGESLIVWDKVLAARVGDFGGYGICRVFSRNMHQVLMTTIPNERELHRILKNIFLREWFPSTITQIRHSLVGRPESEDFSASLQELHSRNWRFWVYVSPVIAFPKSAARIWCRGVELSNRARRLLKLLVTYPIWRRCLIRPADLR
jgi:abequosyltransferase